VSCVTLPIVVEPRDVFLAAGNEPLAGEVSPMVLPVLADCPNFFFALAAVGFIKLEPCLLAVARLAVVVLGGPELVVRETVFGLGRVLDE